MVACNISIRKILFCSFIFYTSLIAVDDRTRDLVTPYLIPEDHPIKEKLDAIFSQTRVILSIKTMEKSGFQNVVPQKFTRVIVTWHKELEGYIIKAYLDAHRYYKDEPEHVHWIHRIEGARAIQQLIDENNLGHMFKVPKKWIYALPEEPAPPYDFLRKNFILVEENMDIYDRATNKEMWGKNDIDPNKLDALYFILEQIGLYDCAKPDNIPFSIDGRIAFVDTQTYSRWPVDYNKLSPYLSDNIKDYWKSITRRKK